VVDQQNADIADNLHLRDVAMATTFWLSIPWEPSLAFYIWGAHWRHLPNTTEPSVCGSDVA